MKSYKAIINYLLAAFIAQGSYFILIPLILHYFGENVYADLELFFVYSSLCFKIFTLNICSAITKHKYDSTNNKDYLEFSSSIFGFGLITTIILGILIVCVIIIKPSFWNLKYSLTALIPLAYLYLFSEYWSQNYFITQKKVAKYRNYQILVGVFKIISIIIVVYVFQILTAFGKIIFEFTLLNIIVLCFIFSEKIKIKTYRFKNDIITALKFSSPLIIWVVINNILNYSDQLFISNYFDKEALAMYSIGYRVGMIIIVFYVAIANYFTIDFYDNFKNKAYAEKNSLKIFTIVYLFALLMLFLGPFYIEYSTNWTGKKLDMAVKINKIIIFSYFINTIFLVYSRKLFFLGKTFKISILASIAAILNIILNFMFLENTTILTAAYTTIFSYTILAFISSYFLIKEDKNFNTRPIIFFFILSFSIILLII